MIACCNSRKAVKGGIGSVVPAAQPGKARTCWDVTANAFKRHSRTLLIGCGG